jgi:hypothetical protein
MNAKKSSYLVINVIVLGFILVSMICAAIYLSKDDSKKKYFSNKEDDEEYNNLNDYFLLKP